MLLLAALAYAQNPLKRADPYAGQFEGNGVVLDLAAANGQYSGTLAVQGQKLPISVKASGDAAIGTFQVAGQSYSFTLTPVADGLKLASEGTEYLLKKRSEPAPSAEGGAVKPENGAKTDTGIVGLWRNAQGYARFNADGTGEMDGNAGRYEIRGNQLTLISTQGRITLQFEVRGDTLTLAVNGVSLALNRVREEAGPGGIRAELVGKWCWVSVVNAQQGARTSNQCYVLNPDGTYQYSGASDSYNPYGGATSQTSDSGTWTATETKFTANSRLRGTIVFSLEKRNHPKNRDPMIVLNRQAYVTSYQKAPW